MLRHTIKLSQVLIIFALSLVVGCHEEKETTHTPLAPVEVKVYKVTDTKHISVKSLPATVQSQERAEISTRIMGNLVLLSVEEGQSVKKGQVIGRIMNNDLLATRSRVEANIAEAQAMLGNVEKDVKRIQSLFEKGSATQKELDDVTSGKAMAQARVNAAGEAKKEVEAQLAYSTLVVPFDGWVTHKFMNQGAMASPGMPIVTIEGNKGMKIVARATEMDLVGLQKGRKAQVQIPSMNKEISAAIHLINQSSSFTGAQYEVTLLPSVQMSELRPGQFARVLLKDQEAKEMGLWLPDSLIHHRGGLDAVYVVSDKQEALLRWVKLGKNEGGYTQILSGLDPEDTCIASANGRLIDGVPVTIVQ